MSRVSEFDVEELVRGMYGLDDEVDVIDYMEEKEIMWDSFNDLINKLLPLIQVGKSPLTKKIYKGFGKEGVFFIKQEVE